ncbi:MAG TPA: hypothetical protein VMP13_08410 [Acidimicrobiia bacterium]|nr:hypothetical protein [Acidimicrobiia bacterium]
MEPVDIGPEERRENVPNTSMVADQLLDDLRNDPRTLAETHIQGIWDVGGAEYLDAVGTIAAHDLSEDDLIELAIELARRVIDLERSSE